MKNMYVQIWLKIAVAKQILIHFPNFEHIGYFIYQETRLYFMMCNKSKNSFPNMVNQSTERSLVESVKPLMTSINE